VGGTGAETGAGLGFLGEIFSALLQRGRNLGIRLKIGYSDLMG
jgi:hypothetical protein